MTFCDSLVQVFAGGPPQLRIRVENRASERIRPARRRDIMGVLGLVGIDNDSEKVGVAGGKKCRSGLGIEFIDHE